MEKAPMARGIVVPPAPILRVLIAGGGTGGHIYPALAVADEIKRRNKDSRVLFVGTRKGLEARLVPEAGYDISFINVSGFAGRNFLARTSAVFQLGSAVLEARRILKQFQPELVLGTGGYVSGPAVLAGCWGGIKTMIQEQNSIPGQMNRFLARWVDEIHIAFTESRLYFKQKSKIRLSGNPTRIREPRGGSVELRRRMGLLAGRKTVMVVGGSRGARSLNRAVREMLPRFTGCLDIQFILQTGQEDQEAVAQAVREAGVVAVVRAYLAPIEEAYALADLVVCRAGAMTLAEVGQFGLPAILVPYPHAIYQHQLRNARILADKGAADVILDGDLGGSLLAERISQLLADEKRLRDLGLNAYNLSRPDAHERLVNAIEHLTHPVEKREPVNLVDEERALGRPGAED
jgi:UDP-N-acetylglucosamine--N-acetylmuramyl-(pentapeptide) pyrophosphoryl-undecaprenol N-acetylglucosamine transferase